MADDHNQLLQLVRTQWFSFVKWTTGISIFLLTVSITIFSRIDNVNDITKITLFGVVLWCVVGIILTWSLLNKALFGVYTKMVEGSDKDNPKFQENIENIKQNEGLVFGSFISGVVWFLIFLIMVIL